jgi:hypothetical protein
MFPVLFLIAGGQINLSPINKLDERKNMTEASVPETPNTDSPSESEEVEGKLYDGGEIPNTGSPSEDNED